MQRGYDAERRAAGTDAMDLTGRLLRVLNAAAGDRARAGAAAKAGAGAGTGAGAGAGAGAGDRLRSAVSFLFSFPPFSITGLPSPMSWLILPLPNVLASLLYLVRWLTGIVERPARDVGLRMALALPHFRRVLAAGPITYILCMHGP